MKTYKDLADYVWLEKGNFKLDKFFTNFKNESQKGIAYEGLTHLYIKLKYSHLKHYSGNPLKQLTEIRNLIEDWYQLSFSRGNEGGVSDITFSDEKGYIFTSVKSSPQLSETDSGIHSIKLLEKCYPISNYYMFCSDELNYLHWSEITKEKVIFVRSSQLERYLIELVEEVSDPLKHLLQRRKTLPLLKLQDHQIMTLWQLYFHRVNSGGFPISLLGHKPRSGKSYIFAGDIRMRNSQQVLFISSIPEATFDQIETMFRSYQEFEDYQIRNYSKHEYNSYSENPTIHLMSIQWLWNNVSGTNKNFRWCLNNLQPDLIYVDEIHHVQSTPDNRRMLVQFWSKAKCPMVLMTATYISVIQKWFELKTEDIFTWSLEDKKKVAEGFRDREMRNRFLDGKRLIFNERMTDLFMFERSCSYYHSLPQLTFLSTLHTPEFKPASFETGFSISKIFELNQKQEFVHDRRIVEIFNYLLGHPEGDSSRDVQGRIKKFGGNKVRSQIWFLPTGLCSKSGGNNSLNSISEALIKRIVGTVWANRYHFLIINSKQSYKSYGGVKNYIEQNYGEVQKFGEKLIILAGCQLTMGISLPFVDMVVLLNNSTSLERLVQMAYRSLTEDPQHHKERGYVVDLNQHRSLTLALDIATQNNQNRTKVDLEEIFYLVSMDPEFITEKETREKIFSIWRDHLNNNSLNIKLNLKDEWLDRFENEFSFLF